MNTRMFIKQIKLKMRIIVSTLILLPSLAHASSTASLVFGGLHITGAKDIKVEGYDHLFDVTFRTGSFTGLYLNGDNTSNDISNLDAVTKEDADKFSRALFSQVITGNLIGNPGSISGCNDILRAPIPVCQIATPYHFDALPESTDKYSYYNGNLGLRSMYYSSVRNQQIIGADALYYPEAPVVEVSYNSGSIERKSLSFEKRVWADWSPSKKSVAVPEIDAATLPLSIGLLLGFIAFIREKRLTTLSVNS